MQRKAVNRPGPREGAWPKQEVKALKQALKSVPAALDKNERFKRVALLVGANHSKKECYDKYRELKAEAKLKQNTARKSSEVSVGMGRSWGHRHTVTGYDDNEGPSPCGPATGKCDSPHYGSTPEPASAGNQDDFECASIATGSVAASAGSERSRRGSTFSSWSSNSAEYFGQQQHYQHRRRSTTSSTLSSVMSGSMEDTKADGTTASAGTGTVPRRGGGTNDAPREATYDQGELMEVEEVDLEDLNLDNELLVEENHSTVGAAQARVRGQGGLESPRQNVGGRVGVGRSGHLECSEIWTVTEKEANGVRELIFGRSSKSFNDAWREQGFYFCSFDGLRYGLVQAEGGPCGVLAVVQAFLLEDMIFGDSVGCDWRNPKRSQRERSLTAALSSIIWRAGDGKTAILAVSEGTASVQRSSRYKPDGFTERVKFHRASSRTALQNLVRDNLEHFTDSKGQGVILLVYSCIFSRGMEGVRGDMDNSFGESSTLMASHGYASQELVNLLLLGFARSNVFDGRRSIGDEDGDVVATRDGGKEEEGEGSDCIVLTGVLKRGRVGLLTLFEAYKHVEVGDRLKNPELPVWIVCSESHYSVLFCLDRSIVPTAAEAATAALEATRNQLERGVEGNHVTSASSDATKDHIIGGRKEKGVPRLSSGERTRGGAYARAADQASHQDKKDDSETFDLEYYDGLGRQDEVIRLTVDQGCRGGDRTPAPTIEDEANGALVPPLDLVIRTRWPGATVDWNGTDPIL